MKRIQVSGSSFVLPQSSVAVLVWAGLCSVWWIWTACTLRFPELGFEGTWHIMPLGAFLLVTLIDVLLVSALVFEFGRARRTSSGVRRAHSAGLALGMLLVVLLQVWAWRAYSSIELPLAAG